MKKKFYILFLLLFSFSFSGEARRVIERNQTPSLTKLYAFSTYLYDSIQKGRLPENFTKQDVAELTGLSLENIHYKIILLKEIGVLEVTKQDGKLQYYRFQSPFDKRDNLELLAGIRELHRAIYKSDERKAVVPIIKEKIAALLDAKESLNIRLSAELEREFPELKRKFLIAIAYPGLIDLFKGFSSIGLKRGENLSLSYDNLHNTFTLSLSPAEIQKALSDDLWEIFLDYDGLRRQISLLVIGEDTQIESILSQFEAGLPFEVDLQAIEFLKGLLQLTSRIVSPQELTYSSELYLRPSQILPHDPTTYGLNLLESFIALRNQDGIQPLYQNFTSNQKEVFSLLRKFIQIDLLPIERAVLVFRYFKHYTLKETAQALEEIGITDREGRRLTGERVRQIEAKAWDKLKHPARRRQLQPLVEDTEEIFHQLYTILYPEN